MRRVCLSSDRWTTVFPAGDATGATVLSVNELACEAVEFMAKAQDSHVRELPGYLTAE